MKLRFGLSKFRVRETKATLLITIFILSTMAVLLPIVPVSAVEIRVGPSETYTTIQAAVDAAQPEDTIIVADGDYTEFVIVTVEGVTIRGESLDAVVTGGFRLEKDDITIDGLTIQLLASGYGIVTAIQHHPISGTASGTKGHKIINNEIIGPGTESGWGIVISTPYYAPVETNILVDNNKIHGGWSCGMIIEGHGNIITNNDVYGNKKGIELEDTNDNVVMYNDLHDNRMYGFGSTNDPIVGNVVNYNNIYDGIVWNSEIELDATLNWWGTTVQSEIVSMVSGSVKFNPWLPADVETSISDDDGDGFTYIEEIALGTDPNDGNDFPGALIEDYVSEFVEVGSGIIDAEAEISTEVNYDANDETAITVAKYTDAPEDESTFSSASDFIDVHVDDPSNLDRVEIIFHYLEADIDAQGLLESELRLYYWTGSAWEQCSNTGVDTGADEIWAILDWTTTPDLDYLSGGPFGPGSPSPLIVLSPTTGFATTITGDWFSVGNPIIIKWGTTTMITFPTVVTVQFDGTFIAMVTALNSAPGPYTISADDGVAPTAYATFTVPDMTGAPGPTGATGSQGPEGSDGSRGSTGPMGPAGSQGLQGELGPQGEIGLQGLAGNVTTISITGEQGPQGELGQQGETVVGPQGEPGTQGEQGPAGLQGEEGPAGPQGEPASSSSMVGVIGGTVVLSSMLAVVISYVLKNRT